MTTDRDALLQALDRAAAPVRFFIRDDDAGWDDTRLHALLDVTAAAGVPIDLAVIPDALNDELAKALAQRQDRQPLGLHQHGCSHHNHQAEGRKCEFGDARPAEARRHDLQRGQQRLADAFGARLDPIFTPPWNRCSDDTPAQLAGLGFAALSRDAGAKPQQALPEWPVHCDWTRQRRLGSGPGGDLGARVAADLARHVDGAAAVGLMLHHAEMDGDERSLLGQLLERWAAHPQARWVTMRALISGSGR
jgi:peptidoglycan/xylan/chitin deacetylase (PgdA/CDA1 family)